MIFKFYSKILICFLNIDGPVGENINLDFSVIINKLFSTKYQIDILDLTKQLKGTILPSCF